MVFSLDIIKPDTTRFGIWSDFESHRDPTTKKLKLYEYIYLKDTQDFKITQIKNVSHAGILLKRVAVCTMNVLAIALAVFLIATTIIAGVPLWLTLLCCVGAATVCSGALYLWNCSAIGKYLTEDQIKKFNP